MAASRCPAWLLAGCLMLMTAVLYWPALQHDFVNFDDEFYVTANERIQAGLTLANLKWAFFEPARRFGYWHPLTLMSHMLDCQMYGLKPWGHHLTSVLLHALNTVLVFLLFRRLTGAVWRSFFLAAFFGFHPTHVESVAWVAERKDVLSTFFGLLSLICYVRYIQELKIKNVKFKIWYGLSLLCFACGLLSKPMLVTWPFLMLLLDYWPLQRIPSSEFRVPGSEPFTSSVTRYTSLFVEKIPFFALAAAACGITFAISRRAGALAAGEHLPAGVRIGNALVSYCRYLEKLFWPENLAVFYPHPGHWPMADVTLAGLVLAGISGLCLWQSRQRPFLLMGWLWFVGMLVPVIGLVQVGEFAMADRFTYVSSLGVFLLVIWGLGALATAWRLQPAVLPVLGAITIAGCAWLTRQQLGYWQDSESLFRHALDVTQNNYLAHNNLGTAFGTKGRLDDAITEYREAIRLKPDYAYAHYGLAVALHAKGRDDEATGEYREAVRLKPDYADAHNNLGNALLDKDNTDEAILQFQEALRFDPDSSQMHNNLGLALIQKDRIDEAIGQFQHAIALKPDFADARFNLGVVLFNQGRAEEAAAQFREVLRLRPDDANARESLARAMQAGQTQSH